MSRSDAPYPRKVLVAQLQRLSRLRWLAGVSVVFGAPVAGAWLNWFDSWRPMAVTGWVILAYNVGIWLALRAEGGSRTGAMLLTWIQIAADLSCLTLLALWTGGAESPLLGFFVFHMVFASLLLSRVTAYAVAAMATAMLAAGLQLDDQWPVAIQSRLVLAGWVVTLLLTIYLANHITSRMRRHQRKLARQNRRIRALVSRLRRQQEALIQHEKIVAVGQTAAGVAHEIANPLANMDSILQLMQRSEKRLNAENVAKLREQVARIKGTIQQLTEFVHPTEYHWKQMPINQLAELGLQMVQFDRRRKMVQIERQYSEDNCRLRVQPHAVQQVLTNLVLNALDAVADASQPRIVVGTECGSGEVRITVSDNGPGISAEHLPRVFEPFFTTKPVGKGTGLGLAISERLAREHGGRIEVGAVVGGDTSMTLVLPIGGAGQG